MKENAKKVRAANGGPLGVVLFIAYIGAVVYFWLQANGFWGHVWVFFKAIAWPGILVYQAMRHLGV